MKRKSILLVVFLVVIIGSIFFLQSMKVNPPEIEVKDNGEIPEVETQVDTESDSQLDSQRQREIQVKSSKYVRAPELVGTQKWINSEELKLSELRDKVVLIDFWTYTCINCIRTFPHLKEWDDKYRGKGLVIIGVHTPEFEFEKKYENVVASAEKYDLKYAIVQDNDYTTWRAYKNRYWPRKYLIDRDGFIRYDHIGEGSYEKTEAMIQTLLNELGEDTSQIDLGEDPKPSFGFSQTPELYAGYKFSRKPLGNPEGHQQGKVVDYKLPDKIDKDKIYIKGKWKNNQDDLKHEGDGFILLKFSAKTINIVASPMGSKNVEMDIYLDGEYVSREKAGEDIVYDGERSYVLLDDERLYNLIGKGNKYGTYTIKIQPNSNNFFWSAFTFGS